MYMPCRPKDHGQKDKSMRFLEADVEWAIYQLEAEKEKAELGSVVIPSSTPDRYEEIACTRDIFIPMRDGIRLCADIFSLIFERVVANPARNETWDNEIFNENLHQLCAGIKVPAYHFAGWYDNFLQSTIEDWQATRDESGNAGHKQIIIGPWDHNYTAPGY
jgi:predicted acyl esterase